ncbi:PREDICTED: small VCP/p97-interacting protein [Corvus brachyrhynchos]|uniref:small VCP/p97-interacting protein n=1 Tax=Corvus brachyrhynchos TaxID=85066 RepID=UPI0008164F69|nr:PREDICTED: small VCP/p97-interacting protein [Corvus brachyrhynchos]
MGEKERSLLHLGEQAFPFPNSKGMFHALRAISPQSGLSEGMEQLNSTFSEIKRRQLAEAAEKRQMEASSRGIKNAYAVEQKKKKQEEIEKRIAASRPGGEGGLRWQVG